MTSLKLTAHLDLEGIRPSIGSVGDAYDNALMECVNGLYKTECIPTTISHDRPFKTTADVEYATAGWVEWYNNERLHGSLSMMTPSSSSKPSTRPSTRIEAAQSQGDSCRISRAGSSYSVTHESRE